MVFSLLCDKHSAVTAHIYPHGYTWSKRSDSSHKRFFHSSTLCHCSNSAVLIRCDNSPYRGGIYLPWSDPHGSKPIRKGAAVLFSALAFGLMHGNIPQAASAFGTGLVYAIIAAKCGSILPTVIIHCLNNLLANFSSISDAIGLEHYETFMSVAEIVIGLVGFMVLFTSLKKLIIDDSENVLTPKECRRYVFTNPATIVYMLCLIIPIVKSLVQANS